MLALIKHDTSTGIVEQRASDGYINATALCKAAGKKWDHYNTNQQTKDFLDELSSSTGIPVIELVQSKAGPVANGGGTWVHHQVATHLAQWASPKFAVQVSKWVVDWLSNKSKSLPVYLDRYLRNQDSIPIGYFSTLQIAATHLVGKLHAKGFDLPNNWVPDISLGLTYCKYLKTKGVSTDDFPTYEHDYFDGRPTYSAKLYPQKYLDNFLTWFSEVWVPTYGVKYFKMKDKESGLNSMNTVIQLSEFKLLKNV